MDRRNLCIAGEIQNGRQHPTGLLTGEVPENPWKRRYGERAETDTSIKESHGIQEPPGLLKMKGTFFTQALHSMNRKGKLMTTSAGQHLQRCPVTRTECTAQINHATSVNFTGRETFHRLEGVSPSCKVCSPWWLQHLHLQVYTLCLKGWTPTTNT